MEQNSSINETTVSWVKRVARRFTLLTHTVPTGVMMEWERPIMNTSVSSLVSTISSEKSNVKVLNVGFGLGIFDGEMRRRLLEYERPEQHIIEAHPDVWNHMRETGWTNEDSTVVAHFGKWQDVVPRLIERTCVCCFIVHVVVFIDAHKHYRRRTIRRDLFRQFQRTLRRHATLSFVFTKAVGP